MVCKRNELDNLRQTESFEVYLHNFQTIINKVTGMSELDKMYFFTKGLANKTKAEVKYQDPTTLNEAIRIATRYEKNFFENKNKNETQQIHLSQARSNNNNYQHRYNTQYQRNEKYKCQ